MSISSKIKGAVISQERQQKDAAQILEISTQAWRNKLSRQSFSIKDLIILADGLGLRLVLTNGKGEAVARFDVDDLPAAEEC